MSIEDPVFSDRVLSTKDLPRPRIIRTVGEAIDFVNELPGKIGRLSRWQAARGLLYDAYDHPENPEKVTSAEEAFRSAMKEQHWLVGAAR